MRAVVSIPSNRAFDADVHQDHIRPLRFDLPQGFFAGCGNRGDRVSEFCQLPPEIECNDALVFDQQHARRIHGPVYSTSETRNRNSIRVGLARLIVMFALSCSASSVTN